MPHNTPTTFNMVLMVFSVNPRPESKEFSTELILRNAGYTGFHSMSTLDLVKADKALTGSRRLQPAHHAA
jgi:hypothetical protein